MKSTQSIASIARQVLAVAISILGVITANGTAFHLPAWASAILIAFAPVLLSIEHFVSDPSTGTPPAPPVAAPPA